MPQSILFATNRVLKSINAGIPDFGDEPMPSSAPITCALATVDGISIDNEDSGTITHVSPLAHGSFSAGDLQPLLASTNDVLVFIHGFANDFSMSVTRAAYNQNWMSKANLPGINSNYDVIVFSWPGRKVDFSSLSVIVDALPDYEHDRDSADASGAHISQFFKLLYAIRGQLGARRMNLLSHSMGCFALGGAVETWFSGANVPPQPLFDEVILAAGDEIATTFTTPRHGRLSNLHLLGREITVYFNEGDIAMLLSRIANWAFHLGYDGPPNKADLSKFPKKVYEFVNCENLKDYISQAIDHTHQYYRESPTVRADIVTSLAGRVPVRPKYDAQSNVYSFI